MLWTTANGTPVSPLGLGTWYLGEHPDRAEQELAAIRTGIEEGVNLLDTAEMYGDGGAEILLGDAIASYDREKLFVVSKVYPWNAGRDRIFRACEDSLDRLDTDYLDLYLLHWRGSVPFAETVECMQELIRRGLIRNWGVSNLDTADMLQLAKVPGGKECLTDQVLYHLGSRGIEYDLLPLLQKWDVPVMAYCPLAQAGSLRRGLLTSPAVREVASSHNATPQQVLLAFLLSRPNVFPIPRTSSATHAKANARAIDVKLSAEDLALLDSAFPAPRHKVGLDMQ